MRVVGIKLNEGTKIYYFDAADVNVHEKCTVIVETEKGLQFGTVVKFIPETDINPEIILWNNSKYITVVIWLSPNEKSG